MEPTLRKWQAELTAWWGRTSLNQKLRLFAGLGAGVAILVVGVSLVASPRWQPLYTNLSAASAGQITQQLQQMKVPYELTQGGSTILVPASQVDQARVELADANVPSKGTVGVSNPSLFGGLGESDQQIQAAELANLEQQLSDTVSSINAVQTAKVFISEPEPTLFGAPGGTPSGSVYVDLRPGQSLSTAQVRGIMNLVAHTVPGLQPNQVAVVDQNGIMLSAAVLAANSATGTASSQFQAEQAVDTQIEQNVESLLDQMYGPGQSVVRVSAVLNFNSQTISQITYGHAVPQQTETTTQSAGPGGAASPSGAGTSANIPGGTVTTTASGSGASASSNTIDKYDVNQTTTTTKIPPGAIKQLHVAVAVNKKLSPAETQSLRNLVAQAAGVVPGRGDQVTILPQPFNTSQAQQVAKEMAAAESRAQYIHWAEELVLLVVGVLLLLSVYRSYKRWQTSRPAVAPVTAREALLSGVGGGEAGSEELTQSVASLIRQLNTPGIRAVGETSPGDINIQQIRQLMKQDPAGVARLLRTWLAEDET